MAENREPYFDWVKARHDCTAVNFFNRLKLSAESNVNRRNEVAAERAPLDGGVQFRFAPDATMFSVFIEGNAATGVRIRLQGQQIVVEGTNVNVNFSGNLMLTGDARCRLRVGNDELDEWQVLRRALEPLFFHD